VPRSQSTGKNLTALESGYFFASWQETEERAVEFFKESKIKQGGKHETKQAGSSKKYS